ncbi:GlsB/YeaQ/YmgE family stress response membrane protein [Ktedonosporobacter rubrisoli]|uniref:GlsB/YeaQ/YmgE family stress response membrane protein n=1 Tax=Ktedonosporobacter rubrisoli TaxID=2509675 RepID=A0A4P6JU60_KTERU|nr:GlsB/YeaQ/YmgE family stress response membrane protein [Ktedonosporobacter rubrisoli]QBD79159.1 GlsB/YeaQ/YmgE family stress response membrane protein [Ktedonosporobacter rubrisoli]
MLAHMLVLADGVTIQIGGNAWSFNLSFLLYLFIAAIVGLIAEYIVGWRLPLGIIGAIIAALIGIWLMTHLIVITGVGDIFVFGVPIVRALVGAIVLVALWHLLTYGLVRHRYRRA